MEEEIIEEKDHSRPLFLRKPGEVGLYFDVDDAVPEDKHAYGSEHLMRVEMNEMLNDHLARADLVRIKGELEKRGHFQGVILEEFRKGILAVCFDSLSAIKDMQALFDKKQVSPMFQTILVDKAMLKTNKVRKLTIRVRTWQDEIEACVQETAQACDVKIDIHRRARDVELLRAVRRYQQDHLLPDLQKLRDLEASFDQHLSEFLLVVKRSLPQNTDSLPSLKDFQTSVTVAMGTAGSEATASMEPVRSYLGTLDFMRALLEHVDARVCVPMSLVPSRCENEKQREWKKAMKSACAEMQRLLRPTTSIKGTSFKSWEGKVLPRERSLFMGLISLVPLGLEKLSDIDHYLDEYITNFPGQI